MATMQGGDGGRDIAGSKPSARPTGNGTNITQNADFSVRGMGNESANGGDVNRGNRRVPMDYEEYNGKKGTDGFSKTGGR